MEQDLAALLCDSPGTQYRFARHPGVQPLRDPVDEEIRDRELAQIPGGEGFVLLPQPLGDLAHRRPTQETPPLAIPEGRLDVPRAQPPRIHLDGQPLQFSCSAGQARPDPRLEGLQPIRHLRDPVLDRTLGGLQPSAPIAVPVPGPRRGPARVVPAAHRLTHLGLQRLLHDLPDGQLDQFGARVTVADPLLEKLLKLLVGSLGCGYPLAHRGCSSCRRRQPATLGLGSKQECIPARFSIKSRTSPTGAAGRARSGYRTDPRAGSAGRPVR